MMRFKKPWLHYVGLMCLMWCQIDAAESAVRSRPNSSISAIEIEVTDKTGISSVFVFQEGQLQGVVKKNSPEARKSYPECPTKVTLTLKPGNQHLHKHRVVYGTCGKATQVITHVTPAGAGVDLIDPIPSPWEKGTLQKSIVPRQSISQSGK